MENVETVTFTLPDGKEQTLPIRQIETQINVQTRVVLDDKIYSPPVALTILHAQRQWWKLKAQSASEVMTAMEAQMAAMETKLADAQQELQHLRGATMNVSHGNCDGECHHAHHIQIPVYDGLVDPKIENGLYLHPKCHPNAATWVFVVEGAARVECAECGKEVLTVALATDYGDDEEGEEWSK